MTCMPLDSLCVLMHKLIFIFFVLTWWRIAIESWVFPSLGVLEMVVAMFGSIISITHHSSLITHHSLLITHHSKYPTRLEPSLTCHHSIFFTLFVDPILVTRCSFFFFFFSITKPSERRRKKKKKKRNSNQITEPSERRRWKINK